MVANFKTFESQSRLLAAIVAAHPGVKWDYKAIAKHYGSDTTVSSIEHRFRPIKKMAAGVQQVVVAGKDPKDYGDIAILNEKEIARIFGESTRDGIEFQFRGIKKDAKALKAAADNGQDPVAAHAALQSTPRSNKSNKTATPRATKGSGAGGTKRKSAAVDFFSSVRATADGYDDDAAGEIDFKPVKTEATGGKVAASGAKGRKRQKQSFAGLGSFSDDDDDAAFFDDFVSSPAKSTESAIAADQQKVNLRFPSEDGTPSLTTSYTGSDSTGYDGAAFSAAATLVQAKGYTTGAAPGPVNPMIFAPPSKSFNMNSGHLYRPGTGPGGPELSFDGTAASPADKIMPAAASMSAEDDQQGGYDEQINKLLGFADGGHGFEDAAVHENDYPAHFAADDDEC